MIWRGQCGMGRTLDVGRHVGVGRAQVAATAVRDRHRLLPTMQLLAREPVVLRFQTGLHVLYGTGHSGLITWRLFTITNIFQVGMGHSEYVLLRWTVVVHHDLLLVPLDTGLAGLGKGACILKRPGALFVVVVVTINDNFLGPF